MKLPMLFSYSALTLLASLTTALTAHASGIIVDDTWADGNRTSSGIDGSGIDSAWYSSTAAYLTATAGSMSAAVPSTTSLTFWTYFANAGAPISLGTGDTLKVTLNFSVTGVGAQNTSHAFNFGLFDSSAGTRRTTDSGSPGGAGVTGYRQSMNFGATLGQANGMSTQRRTSVTDANLLSTSSDYTTIGVNGGGNAFGAAGFNAGTPYTLFFSITRTSDSSINITTTITDGSALTLSQTVTDSSSPITSFDTLAFRPTTGNATATGFTFTELKIETIPVPEPASCALLSLGLLGTAAWHRRKR